MKKYAIGAAVLAATAIVIIRAQEPQAPAPTDFLGLMQAGDAAVAQRQMPQADLYYAQAVALGDRPEIAPALQYLGIKAFRERNYLAAEGFFERMVALDPNGPQAGRALTWLGNIKARDPESFADAEALYQKALAVENPPTVDTIDTLRNYAYLLKRMGRTEEAFAADARSREIQDTALKNRPKQALAKDVYRTSDGASAPVLLNKIEPQYTEEARAGRIQGVTLLYAEIGTDGAAHNIKVTRSLEPGLDQQAIDAVSQWQFQPGQKDGAEVTVASTIEINWRLQ